MIGFLMGKASRDKGAGFEREMVNWHRNLGMSNEDIKRVPLSGAAEGFKGDLQIKGMLGECKRRKSGNKRLYDWISQDDSDFLFIRDDNKEALVVMPLKTWESVLKWMKWI